MFPQGDKNTTSSTDNPVMSESTAEHTTEELVPLHQLDAAQQLIQQQPTHRSL